MNAHAKSSRLVTIGKHTFVADDIIAFKVEESAVRATDDNPDGLYTVVWVRSHRGQWNFGEYGNHAEALSAAMEAVRPAPLVELRRGVKGPSKEDLEHFQYVLDNSDPEADEDDPFVRLARWALALPRAE